MIPITPRTISMKDRLFASYANKQAIGHPLMALMLYYLLGAELRVEMPLNVTSVRTLFK